MCGAHNYPDSRKPIHQLLASGIRHFRKVLPCLVKTFGLAFDIAVGASWLSESLQPICSRRAKEMTVPKSYEQVSDAVRRHGTAFLSMH